MRKHAGCVATLRSCVWLQHEELVLMLIQLKRAQSRLESDRDYYRSRLEEIRPTEKEYKLK